MPFIETHGALQGLCCVQRHTLAAQIAQFGFCSLEQLLRDTGSLPLRQHRHPAQMALSPAE